jgi:hypothetical protein
MVTRPAPPNHERLPYFDCSTSRAPPVIDSIFTATNLISVGLVAGSEEKDTFMPIMLGLGVAAVWAASAVYGFTKTDECQKALALLGERSPHGYASRGPPPEEPRAASASRSGDPAPARAAPSEGPEGPRISRPPATPPVALDAGAWVSYHTAFHLLASGQSTKARFVLKNLLSRPTGHAAEAWSTRVMSALNGERGAPPEQAEDDVWYDYHLAFELLALQRHDEATAKLRGLADRRDGHPAAVRAAHLLRAAGKR